MSLKAENLNRCFTEIYQRCRQNGEISELHIYKSDIREVTHFDEEGKKFKHYYQKLIGDIWEYDGEFIWWNIRNGGFIEQSSYLNGKLEGIKKTWKPNGEQWSIKKYKDGKEVEKIF